MNYATRRDWFFVAMLAHQLSTHGGFDEAFNVFWVIVVRCISRRERGAGSCYPLPPGATGVAVTSAGCAGTILADTGLMSYSLNAGTETGTIREIVVADTMNEVDPMEADEPWDGIWANLTSR